MANTGGVVVPPIQFSLTTTASIPTLKRTRSRTDSLTLNSPSDSPLCSPRVAFGDKPITPPSTLGDLLAAAKKIQPITEEVASKQPLQQLSETTTPTTTTTSLTLPSPQHYNDNADSKVEKSDHSATRETPKADLHLKPELQEKKKEENVEPLTDAWDTAVANTPRPSEPKQRSFAPDPSWNPEVVPPTSVLHPSGTSAWEAMNFFFVAPLTLLTPTNLFYQLYLMEIFHTKFASRAVHAFMMPMVTWSYLLFAAHIGLPFSFFNSVGFAETGINIFEIRGNAVLTLSFFIWYLYWGIKSKTYAFGLFMIPQLCLLWLSSNVYYLLTRNSDSLLLNPFFLAFAFAFIQTMSHAIEDLPPRMNGSDHWMTYDQFFARHGYNYLKVGYIIGVSIICGTINEFLAGPRLLPLLTLRLMYSLGYQKKDWKELKKVVAMAKQSADPAIDFVGSGGTLPHINVEPPQTLADALQELQELKWRRVRNRGFEDEELELRVAYLLLLLSKVPETASLPPASPAEEEEDEEEKEEEEENNEPQELSEESLGEPETEHIEWEVANLALKRANSCPLSLSVDAAHKPPEEKLRKRRKSL